MPPQESNRPLLDALGVQLGDDLLTLALTHRSYAYENGDLPTNERLEFLGDAVLGLVVTETLYRSFPEYPEGHLAKLRSAVVNMRALASVARQLRIGPHIRLGHGETTSGGHDKSSILADTLEALLGAVYLQHGIEVAGPLVHRLIDPLLESSRRLGAGLDWKTSAQELTSQYGLGVPQYAITESGPDHNKRFHADFVAAGRTWGHGKGHSKKEAEQQAAQMAFTAITAEYGGFPHDATTDPTSAALAQREGHQRR